MGRTETYRSATAIAALVCCASAASVSAQHVFDEGASLYASACAECHGENGDAIEGIDLARGQFSRPFTDNELAALIMNGIPDTEMGPADLDEDDIEELVLYLRDLALPREEPRLAGNAERGKALFEGKGECTDCHRIDGNGARIGPDLSRIGRFRRAGHIMESLLDPEKEVQPNNRFYRVVTSAGEEVKGRAPPQGELSF
jgi:cytochrome c oxidase cbb3-type subunit 3